VSFTYPGKTAPALQDLSFELPPGQHVALVGASGAGKTSLFNLLLRFWEPDAGQILLGGADLCRFSPEPLRRRIGLIAQSTVLFNLTVRQNILLARPEASVDEVVLAARRAQLHDFILSLPQGYDTWIGECGLRLSAGERQRLAVARALLKDAPLLLLDEPAANLDPLTERDLLDTLFESVFPGRSVLWITHRLTCMDRVDEILVLAKGRIVERGNHAALLARNGRYKQMWQIGEIDP
jgi:ATP-binding cassette subfamily C protein CydC